MREIKNKIKPQNKIKTAALILILLIGCQAEISETENTETEKTTNTQTKETETTKDTQESEVQKKEKPKTFIPLSEREVKELDDGTKYIVHPDEIRSGGPPQDGIPSIDNPKYTTTFEADEWIEDNELVMAIDYKGITRAYPLQILVFHEIVNDIIAGDPVLITYCPLCGSGIAYKRNLSDDAIEFGTSGKLYNSNLVMYDRKTNSYWSQIDGVAIMGELTGTELKQISIDTVSWRDWKAAHPESEVLARDTGYDRPYGQDPYGNYYEDSFLMFPVDNEDDRIHAKTVVFGIEVDGVYKAYKETDLINKSKIFDVVNGIELEIKRTKEGKITITRKDTGEEIVEERDFWFAWYAFHPDTLLYEADN